jgi:hypothetical protein
MVMKYKFFECVVMRMAGYTELIKNFEKIRDFTRDFYIYGFRGRSDYMDVSPRSYDNERRRIESYLSDHIVRNRDNRGKTISISSNTTAKTSNPLFKVWQTKSFTRNDCFLHFIILDILFRYNNLSVSDITEIICRDYSSELNDTESIDTMTIRNKLNEYTKLGILKVSKCGKALNYNLVSNPLNVIKPDTKEHLFDALEFYKNFIPGGFIGHTIDIEMDSPFIYRQIFFAQILDDEILLQLLKAISEKRVVTLNIVTTKNHRVTKTSYVPLKILSNTKTGRRYVSVYSMGKNKFSTIRVDYIKDVAFGDIFPEYDRVKEEYERRMENSFSIVHQVGDRLHKVRMTLSINESTEQYVLERLRREGKKGTIIKKDDNVFEYSIEVSDTLEMVPWLRTFIGRILEIEGSEKGVISQFKRDINTMEAYYDQYL